MRIFMSYASEQKAAAEAIAFSLRSRGHNVFLDRDDLPDGMTYDDKITGAIDRSDLLVFLISPESVASGRYTLTEMRYARHKWRNPAGHILPVMLVKTPLTDVPAYLKAVSIMEPAGNLAAEVSFAAERLRGVERAANIAALVALAGAVLALPAGLMPVVGNPIHGSSPLMVEWLRFRPPIDHPGFQPVAVHVGMIVAALLIFVYLRLADSKWWKLILIVVFSVAGWIVCSEIYLGAANPVNQSSSPVESELNFIVRRATERTSDFGPNLQDAVSERVQKVRAYILSLERFSLMWGNSMIASVSAATFAAMLFLGLSLVNRAFRSVGRLAIMLLIASVAGGSGYLAAISYYGGRLDVSSGRTLWIFSSLDLQLAIMYAPWMMAVPAAIAFWLVRGQDT